MKIAGKKMRPLQYVGLVMMGAGIAGLWSRNEQWLFPSSVVFAFGIAGAVGAFEDFKGKKTGQDNNRDKNRDKTGRE